MPKKKHWPPPAKIKYDKSHPIISIRVTPDLKMKLDDIKMMGNKSVADILKQAVGLQAHSVDAAYKKGFLIAKRFSVVTYRCSVCGGAVEVNTAREKEAIAQYMQEHGWAHGECLNK